VITYNKSESGSPISASSAPIRLENKVSWQKVKAAVENLNNRSRKTRSYETPVLVFYMVCSDDLVQTLRFDNFVWRKIGQPKVGRKPKCRMR